MRAGHRLLRRVASSVGDLRVHRSAASALDPAECLDLGGQIPQWPQIDPRLPPTPQPKSTPARPQMHPRSTDSNADVWSFERRFGVDLRSTPTSFRGRSERSLGSFRRRFGVGLGVVPWPKSGRLRVGLVVGTTWGGRPGVALCRFGFEHRAVLGPLRARCGPLFPQGLRRHDDGRPDDLRRLADVHGPRDRRREALRRALRRLDPPMPPRRQRAAPHAPRQQLECREHPSVARLTPGRPHLGPTSIQDRPLARVSRWKGFGMLPGGMTPGARRAAELDHFTTMLDQLSAWVDDPYERWGIQSAYAQGWVCRVRSWRLPCQEWPRLHDPSLDSPLDHTRRREPRTGGRRRTT